VNHRASASRDWVAGNGVLRSYNICLKIGWPQNLYIYMIYIIYIFICICKYIYIYIHIYHTVIYIEKYFILFILFFYHTWSVTLYTYIYIIYIYILEYHISYYIYTKFRDPPFLTPSERFPYFWVWDEITTNYTNCQCATLQWTLHEVIKGWQVKVQDIHRDPGTHVVDGVG
jgi:hypothetical protein